MFASYFPEVSDPDELYKRGLYAESLTLVNHILEFSPHDQHLQELKGKILLKLKKYTELYEFCDMVIAMSGDSVRRDAIQIAKLIGLVAEKKAEEAIVLANNLLTNLQLMANPFWKYTIEMELAKAINIKKSKPQLLTTSPFEKKSSSEIPQGTSQILSSLKDLKLDSKEIFDEKILEKYVTLDVPNDNSCLFWSAFLALILPTLTNPDQFKKMYATLLGDRSLHFFPNGEKVRVHGYRLQDNFCEALKLYNCDKNFVYRIRLESFEADDNNSLRIRNYSWSLKQYIQIFRERVVDTMDRIYNQEEKQAILLTRKDFKENVGDKIEKLSSTELKQAVNHYWIQYTDNMRKSTGWGGDPEIAAIAELTKTNISMTMTKGTVLNTPKSGTASNTIYLLNTHTDESTEAAHYKFKLHPDIHQKHAAQPTLPIKNQLSDFPSDKNKEFFQPFARSP